MARKYPNPWKRPDLIDEAQRRTKLFIIKIKSLIKNNNFDVILAPGNSGIMMAKLTSMTYSNLNLKCPPIIKFATYLRNRFGKLIHFDNSIIIPDIKKELKDVKNIEKILYVDDDVNCANPRTFKETISILKKAAGEKLSKKATVFVVVEGRRRGGLKRVKRLNIRIKYMPFVLITKEWKAISNFVSYGIPWNIQLVVRKYYSDKVVDSKELFSILLKEPIRDFRNNKPILSHRQENKMKRKIKGFNNIQREFEKHIKSLIKSS